MKDDRFGVGIGASLLIAVKLDGVLAEYHGWGSAQKIGEPLPGAKMTLHRLRQRGHRILLYSNRAKKTAIRWVLKHGFENSVDYVHSMTGAPDEYLHPAQKTEPRAIPFHHLILSERAITFNGSWDGYLDRILDHQVYYEDKAVRER